MSILDYRGSKKVAAEIYNLTHGNEFITLIMAAMRFADSDNLQKLQEAFPEIWAELQMRYNAPYGALSSEEV